MTRRQLAGALLLGAIGWAVLASTGHAETVSIAEVTSRPELQHMKQVTLQGRVRSVQPLEPYFQTSGTACYSAYLFVLEDDTGAVPVAVLGVCGVPVIRPPDVAEGERVVVEGDVQVGEKFGKFLDIAGRPVFQPHGVQVVARDIRHLDRP